MSGNMVFVIDCFVTAGMIALIYFYNKRHDNK